MLRTLAVAALAFQFAAAYAEPVPLPGASAGVAVGRYADMLEDAGGNLGFADVSGPEYAGRFAPIGKNVPNFGYTYSTFWLRFTLPQQTERLLVPMLLVEIRFPSLDAIELHLPYRGAAGLEYRVQRGGDQQPWDSREVKHRNHVFRVPTAGLADAPAYLRVLTQSVLTVPAYLWRPEALVVAGPNAQLVYRLF